MNTSTLTGCIIGAGYIGKIHAGAYLHVPSVRIVAVVDRDLDKAAVIANITGGKAYSSWESMLEELVPDFADICLPSGLHRDAVVSALEQGMDVVVEKPFAIELSDIDAMIESSRRTGRRLMVAHVCRFMPQYVYSRDLVMSGKLGQPLFFGCWRESEMPRWSWNNWILDRSKSGGTIMDLSVHDIHVSNWLLGTPTDHSAFEVTDPLRSGPSHVVSMLSYPGGSRASVEAGHLMPKGYPFTAGFRLLFEKGILEWNTGTTKPGVLSLYSESAKEDIPVEKLLPMAGNDPYAEELAHFAECLGFRKTIPD